MERSSRSGGKLHQRHLEHSLDDRRAAEKVKDKE